MEVLPTDDTPTSMAGHEAMSSFSRKQLLGEIAVSRTSAELGPDDSQDILTSVTDALRDIHVSSDELLVPEVGGGAPASESRHLRRLSAEDQVLAELANIVNSKAYRSRGPSRNLTTSQVLTLGGGLPDLAMDTSDALYDESRINAGVGKLAALAQTDNTFDPVEDLIEVASLGEGAFAVVDLCKTNKRSYFPKGSEAFRTGLVAAKRLKPECIAEEPLEFDNFLTEAALVKTLVHKNVIECYGCVEYTDQYTGAPSAMILLEYLKGGTLRQRISRKDYEGTQALRWLIEIAEGMEYLHSVAGIGVAHRDLKPDNILLDEHGTAKIADMGMARIAMRSSGGGAASVVLDQNYQSASQPPSASAQQPGGLVRNKSFSVTCRTGTPRYMAPENWAGDTYTYKVDVFSYAILAYEVLSGQRAYAELTAMNGQSLADAVAESGLRPKIPPGWPADIVALMVSAWSTDPEQRPDFSSVLLSLRDFQARAATDPTLVENFVSHARKSGSSKSKGAAALPAAGAPPARPPKAKSSMCVIS